MQNRYYIYADPTYEIIVIITQNRRFHTTSLISKPDYE